MKRSHPSSPALSLVAACLTFVGTLAAGPFAPAPPTAGSTAVSHNDERIQFWATGYTNFVQGSNAASFSDPAEALGPAVNGSDPSLDVLEVVSLGRGGQITLTFPQPIADGPGDDFAVFENAFNDLFLELAFVEVSTDGINFLRFPSVSKTSAAVLSYGYLDTTDIDGFAGKYRIAFGTPFDLADLGLSSVTHVRIVDVVGDGNTQDSQGNTIYDPYPTASSAGFDLDAVAVLGTTPDAWRSANFTPTDLALPAVSGDLADPDGDSLANIIERALNTDPHQLNPDSQLPAAAASATHLQLTFPRSLNATNITIHVEASTGLGSWTEIARSTNGSPTQPIGSPGASLITENFSGSSSFVTVQDSVPLSAQRNRFLRLRVTSP